MAEKQYAPNFKPLAGKEYVLYFLWDSPRTGTSVSKKTGNEFEWCKYSVKVGGKDGVEHGWFMDSDELRNMLNRATISQYATVKLDVVQQMGSGNKPINTYKLIKQNGDVYYSHDQEGENVQKQFEESHTVESYEHDNKDMGVAPPPQQTTDAVEQHQPPENEIVVKRATLLSKCLDEAMNMSEPYNPPENKEFPHENRLTFFNGDDVRSLAISLFIQVCGEKYQKQGFKR